MTTEKTHSEEHASNNEIVSEGSASMVPPAFQLSASPGTPPADQPIQRNIGHDHAENDVFTAFGDTHRDRWLNPDEIGERDRGAGDAPGGIRRIEGQDQGARPEDAPLAPEFRVDWHKLHSAKIYLEENYPALYVQYQEENEIDLRQILLDFGTAVKTESKLYKKRVKDLGTDTSIEDLEAQYQAAMEVIRVNVAARAADIQQYITDNSEDAPSMEDIHQDGTGMWRDKWHDIVLAVNRVLVNAWPIWQERLRAWVQARLDDGLGYMNPALINGLDYIGSLAKGYKGPPKQGVRFMPEKFDVDANLDAPVLAAYAIQESGAKIDRGRIWSQDANIEVVTQMEQDIQQQLVAAGLEDMGMDPGEPFEAVIDATNMDQIQHDGAANARGIANMQDYLQVLRDLIHWQRHEDMGRFQNIAQALQVIAQDGDEANLTEVTDGRTHLIEMPDDRLNYPYSDAQILQIAQILRDNGVADVPDAPV